MLRDGGGGVDPCEVLKGVTTGLRGVAGRRRKGALTDRSWRTSRLGVGGSDLRGRWRELQGKDRTKVWVGR